MTNYKKHAMACKWCDGWFCLHKKSSMTTMYCSQDPSCIHREADQTKEGAITMGKKKEKKREREIDEKVIRLMVCGVPYELEYFATLSIKNLNTKREAPLDTLCAEDIEAISNALETAHTEIDEALAGVDVVAEQLSWDSSFSTKANEGWTTGKEGVKDVDDEAGAGAVQACDRESGA